MRKDHVSDPVGTEPLKQTTRPENWSKVVPNDVVCNPLRRTDRSTCPFLAYPDAMSRKIKRSRYAELIRLCIPYNQVASLDVVPDCMPRPPAENCRHGTSKNVQVNNHFRKEFRSETSNNMKANNNPKQEEVLHLYKWYTHTQTQTHWHRVYVAKEC